jgi:hypothetical protein
MTLLSISTLCSRRWCIPKKYKQIARSIESVLDLSMMSIEDAIGHLKVIDDDEPQPLSGSIMVGEKLHLTQEQWEACQSDEKKGESSPSTGDRKRGKPHKARGGGHGGTAGNQKPARNDACHNCGTLDHWTKEC